MSLALGRILLHSSATATMIYGYNGLNNLPVISKFINEQYGGHFQYLTIQCLFIAIATTSSGIALDLFPSATLLRPLKRALLILSMTLSIVVSSIYWPLLLFATQLILQRDGEPSSSSDAHLLRIPLRLDLALHAVPAITLLADFLLFEKKYTKKELLYGAPALSLGYTIFYAWWVERCAVFNNGRFPYPFLTDNSLEIRIGIYAGAGLFALTSFWLINRLHA